MTVKKMQALRRMEGQENSRSQAQLTTDADQKSKKVMPHNPVTEVSCSSGSWLNWV